MTKHPRVDWQPMKDWAPPDVVSALQRDLQQARYDIVEVGSKALPRTTKDLLQIGYSDCKSDRDLLRWEGDVVDEIVAAAKPLPPNHFENSERCICPLCGDEGGRGWGGGRGFTLPLGLQRHLTGFGHTHPCVVMRAAFANARERLKPTIEKHEREKREARAARRGTEPLFMTNPEGPPELIDDGFLRISGHRALEDLPTAEERLRSLGFEVEVVDNVVTYRLPDPEFCILADPRDPRRINFRLFVMTERGKVRRLRGRTLSAEFHLMDAWKRDIVPKFRKSLDDHRERLRAECHK